MKIARRQFIKQTTLGVGLGALAGSTAGRAQAQQAASVEPFTFAVVADPHCAEAPKDGIESYGNGVDKFLACARAMERLALAERPDFMLLAGDVHPWALEEHRAKVRLPIHAVAGNHESDAKKRQQLRDLFPEDFKRGDSQRDYYSFVHKGMLFVGVCDAGMGGEHVGQMCSENIRPSGQCEWIEAQLKRAEARKILFAHIPPERNGADRNMYLSRNDSRWFNALVQQTGPEAMFFGHLHQATEEYRIGETRCFNVRSCCWNFNRAPLGFLLVSVNRDGLAVREVETGAYA